MRLRSPYAIGLVILFISAVSWGGTSDPPPSRGTDSQSGCGCGSPPSTPQTPAPANDAGK